MLFRITKQKVHLHLPSKFITYYQITYCLIAEQFFFPKNIFPTRSIFLLLKIGSLIARLQDKKRPLFFPKQLWIRVFYSMQMWEWLFWTQCRQIIIIIFFWILFHNFQKFTQHFSSKISTLESSNKNLVMSSDDCTSLVGNLGSTNDAISFGPRFLNKLL